MSGLPVASAVAAVEIPCAISARRHRAWLSPDEANLVHAAAVHLLARVVQVALSEAVRRQAAAVAGRHLVRALDAIHLGTALVLTHQQQRRGNTVRFCTADLRQAMAAIALLGSAHVDVLPPLA